MLKMVPTHVRIKGQNLNFYLETHATTLIRYFLHTATKLGTLYWRVNDPLLSQIPFKGYAIHRGSRQQFRQNRNLKPIRTEYLVGDQLLAFQKIDL